MVTRLDRLARSTRDLLNILHMLGERSSVRQPTCRGSCAMARETRAAVSGVGLTRLVNKQDIRTPQRIENRACNDPRIRATDVKSISCGLFSMCVMCFENGIRN
jgi:hypothetical protein